ADGRYVLFTSFATNLVTGDDNNATDVFVRDLRTGTTTLASAAADGTVAGAGSTGVQLSDDGRKALVRSEASDLLAGSSGRQLYLVNFAKHTTTRVSKPSLCPLHEDYVIAGASMSGDATHVAYGVQCYGTPDPNTALTPAELDLVVRDRVAHTNNVVWRFPFQ